MKNNMSVWKPNHVIKEQEKQYVSKIETLAAKVVQLAKDENITIGELNDVLRFVSARMESSFNGTTIFELVNKGRDSVEKVKFN